MSVRSDFSRASDYDTCPGCGGRKSKVSENCRACRYPQSPERFLDRKVVDEETGCWLWTGPLTNRGYAKTPGDRRTSTIHRLIYEHLVGSVDEGRELHQLGAPCAADAH